MVDFSVALDAATIAALQDGLSRLAKTSVEVSNREIRRMGLSICDSLRAARCCPVAPKRIRPKEYRAELSPLSPRYLTYRNHEKLPRPLHRWRLTRKLGTPKQNTVDPFIYCQFKTAKGGGVVKNLTAERRDLLNRYGIIPNRGLARKSWGWAKKAIYNAAPDTADWRASQFNKRDPRQDVSGFFRDFVTGPLKGADLQISNRLDYIGEIIPDSAVNEAVMRGYNSWRHRFENHIQARTA